VRSPDFSYSYRNIFRFWSPLAATWLLMSVEGPFLAALIARLAEPKYNLAAYGVAFSFALIIEAPIIMLLSASTALVSDFRSYLKLRNYTTVLNAGITLIMLFFLLPGVFRFIALDLMELPQKVFEYTYTATLILLPWPAAIGYRRFYQGILIRNNSTRYIAVGTVLRLTAMATAAFLLFLSGAAGHVVGASALSSGVVAEGLFIYLVSRPTVRQIRGGEEDAEAVLDFRSITAFYYPLALTSMLTLGVHPLVTFFMGQSRMALESLAIFPVVNSLIFLFRGVGLSFQEAAITLIDADPEKYRRTRNFAAAIALFNVTGLTVTAFTSLGYLWYTAVSGLSHDLAVLGLKPLIIMAAFPALTVLIAFQRAFLIRFKHTSPITAATALEVGGIILGLYIGVRVFDLPGIYAAAAAFLFGRIIANLYLLTPYNTVYNKIFRAGSIRK